MAKEYIEREAVAKKAICMHGFGNVKYVPLSAIMNQTAADVVEVVRCKNCKHVMLSSIWNPQCYKHEMPVKEDDFCSFGERRDSDGRA